MHLNSELKEIQVDAIIKTNVGRHNLIFRSLVQ